MAFRIVEITKPSECHVTNGQLMVKQEDYEVQIPLEDNEITPSRTESESNYKNTTSRYLPSRIFMGTIV